MKSWKVKRGNTSVQEMEIVDKEDVRLTNLALATEILFQIKNKKTDTTALLEKTAVPGGGIEVDTPSEGHLRITLSPTDTNLALGHYYMALQIKWSAIDIYEVKITIKGIKTEYLEVKQDVIR